MNEPISRECRVFEGDSSYWLVDGKKYLTYEEAIKAIDEDLDNKPHLIYKKTKHSYYYVLYIPMR